MGESAPNVNERRSSTQRHTVCHCNKAAVAAAAAAATNFITDAPVVRATTRIDCSAKVAALVDALVQEVSYCASGKQINFCSPCFPKIDPSGLAMRLSPYSSTVAVPPASNRLQQEAHRHCVGDRLAEAHCNGDKGSRILIAH